VRRAEAATALALLFIGVVVCWEGHRLTILGWGRSGPEPGFYPFLLGLGIVLCSLLVLAQSVRHHGPTTDRPFLPRGGLRPLLSVALPSIGMVLLVPLAGLYIAGGIYLAAYMRWIGRYRIVVAVLAGIVLPVAGYLVFTRWFRVPIPGGLLTSWLGLGV
jgi:hypothetical protein